MDIFPPPGPDRRDSFFARTHTTAESSARLYLGVAAQGRSPKVILLRTYLALLGAAQKWYAAAGGDKVKDNPGIDIGSPAQDFRSISWDPKAPGAASTEP